MFFHTFFQREAEIRRVVRQGYLYLSDNLWDEVRGMYRECPSPNPERLDEKYNPDDNYLAYLFHSEYPTFRNGTRAEIIWSFLLECNISEFELAEKRWAVLSSNYARHQVYNSTEYGDQIALDGLFYVKSGDRENALRCFNELIKKYNFTNRFLEDKATPINGHEYYKLGLALILACHLKNDTYIQRFVEKMLDLQSPEDGSWLTDDKSTSWPNTETTVIILLALDHAVKTNYE